MAFPASVDTFSNKVDHVSTVNAADVNALQTAVLALENFILGGFSGTTPIDLVVRSVTASAVSPYVPDPATPAVGYVSRSGAIIDSPTGYTLRLQRTGLDVNKIDVEAGATTERWQPPVAVAHTNSDAAILTLLRAPFVDGTEANTFVDLKLSFDGASNGVIHLLGDRSGSDVAPNIFTVELDPRNQSANAEFQVIRGSFRGGAGTNLIDIIQGSGLVALDSNKIDLGVGNPLSVARGLLISGGIAMDGAALAVARINMPNTWGFQAAGTDVLVFTSDKLLDFKTGPVALGGGAAPTFGTIGGAGPAAAAQNSWLKLYINAVASYVPVWR